MWVVQLVLVGICELGQHRLVFFSCLISCHISLVLGFVIARSMSETCFSKIDIISERSVFIMGLVTGFT